MTDPQTFIEITDFRPGIYSDLYAANNATAATAAPTLRGQLAIGNGAAVAENTYDCRADKTGALVPFWKRNSGPTHTMLPGGNGITGSYPTNQAMNYLIDARANVRNVRPRNTQVQGASFSTLLYGYFFRPSGAGSFYKFAHGVEFYGTNGASMDTVFWMRTSTTTTDYVVPVGSVLDLRGFGVLDANIQGYSGYYDYAIVAEFAGWDGYYLQTATGTIAANELAFIVANKPFWGLGSDQYDEGSGMLNPDWGATVKYLANIYPGTEATRTCDELTTRTNRPVAPAGLSGGNIPRLTRHWTVHQGRLVAAMVNAQQGGTSQFVTTAALHADILSYSPVNRPTAFQDGVTGRLPWGFLFPGDSPVGPIGAFGSLTADQILIVKANGGGVIIQGDLDRPTVRSVPFVESTHGIIAHGCHTPLGFVYGSRNGVFVWNGGDTTQKISPQLEGFFWDHTQGLEGNNNPYARYGGTRGRMGYFQGCTFVPNNYFIDMDEGGWWRLSGISGEPYNVYDTNNVGDLLAYPWRLTPTQNIVWHWYDRTQLGDSFSWQSQPIIETRGRQISFQDVHIVSTYLGTGTATITLTLTGYTEQGVAVTPATVTFQLTAGANPQIIWKDIAPNFNAEYVQVRIESVAGASTSAAPKIHSMKFGVRDAGRTPKVY